MSDQMYADACFQSCFENSKNNNQIEDFNTKFSNLQILENREVKIEDFAKEFSICQKVFETLPSVWRTNLENRIEEFLKSLSEKDYLELQMFLNKIKFSANIQNIEQQGGIYESSNTLSYYSSLRIIGNCLGKTLPDFEFSFSEEERRDFFTKLENVYRAIERFNRLIEVRETKNDSGFFLGEAMTGLI
mmetsp:Transcript_13608/g.12075  ORF Transcript_13608/g.12075 Transcript_13608/m.12075 type:complete len:189 (+) Transcript_13608:184-750(+)